MLLAGSDDGVYRVDGVVSAAASTTDQVLESGRVKRVRSVEGVVGVFAATESGLYHAPAGTDWTGIDTPEARVYTVGAGPAGDRLFLGTRPAHVFVAPLENGHVPPAPDWTDLEGFQALPSRDDWGLPRHDHVAQVRDVHVPPAAPDRVIAAVEVGGVHCSDDGGTTWRERRDGVDDDVHELLVRDPSTFVAATGFGLFRSTDAGQSWTRLDESFDQRYFRTVAAAGDVSYAGAALANSSTWEDADADPALFRLENDTLTPVDQPRPAETVTGLTAADGTALAGTHRGSLLRRDPAGWSVAGSFPVSDRVTGRYTPLEWVPADGGPVGGIA